MINVQCLKYVLTAMMTQAQAECKVSECKDSL